MSELYGIRVYNEKTDGESYVFKNSLREMRDYMEEHGFECPIWCSSTGTFINE
ncbi:hypothetical protein UFOVP1244_136 [uncultured Caudovirales phage]|uniref:Uncharacterized protein n=1 Tax=uncultured Caudovirales phage TaxID=2100421 RepID=A0A6J5REP8_9CAUD|nr:hypothetical protein UFOVP1244_136 [uncultured Caudovirales phage]